MGFLLGVAVGMVIAAPETLRDFLRGFEIYARAWRWIVAKIRRKQ